MLGMAFLFALPSDAKTSRANAVAWLVVGTPPMLLMHGFVGTLTLDDVWRAALAGLVTWPVRIWARCVFVLPANSCSAQW